MDKYLLEVMNKGNWDGSIGDYNDFETIKEAIEMANELTVNSEEGEHKWRILNSETGVIEKTFITRFIRMGIHEPSKDKR